MASTFRSALSMKTTMTALPFMMTASRKLGAPQATVASMMWIQARQFQVFANTYQLHPGAHIKVRLPTFCHLTLEEADVSEWDKCRLLVDIKGDGVTEDKAIQAFKKLDLHAATDYKINHLLLASKNTPDSNEKVSLRLKIPGHVTLDIEQKSGSISTKGKMYLETMALRIFTQEANIKLSQIRCQDLQIFNEEGEIAADNLHANLNLTAVKGNVECKTIAGSTVNLTLGEGSIDIGALYGDNSSLYTLKGDINVGSVHGSTRVRATKGSITIGGVEGLIEADTNSGNIAVQLSDPDQEDIRLTSMSGDIDVNIPWDANLDVDVESAKLQIDERFESKNLLATDRKAKGTIQNAEAADPEQSRARLQAKTLGGELKLNCREWVENFGVDPTIVTQSEDPRVGRAERAAPFSSK